MKKIIIIAAIVLCFSGIVWADYILLDIIGVFKSSAASSDSSRVARNDDVRVDRADNTRIIR